MPNTTKFPLSTKDCPVRDLFNRSSVGSKAGSLVELPCWLLFGDVTGHTHKIKFLELYARVKGGDSRDSFYLFFNSCCGLRSSLKNFVFLLAGCVEMVKLFIGNLPREATEQEIRSLFEQYGKVLECDIIKNYGFVHIEDKTAAEDAIRNLHHYKLHGVNINVEASKNKSKASTKLHVGNISPTCTNQELRAKFEEYGPVIECDIVKYYSFVHMERAEDEL